MGNKCNYIIYNSEVFIWLELGFECKKASFLVYRKEAFLYFLAIVLLAY